MTGAIIGLSRVESKLAKYLVHKEAQIVDAAQITQSAIKNRARALVRVDTHALQNSIMEGSVELRGTVVRAYVYALQSYAHAQEYGPMAASRRSWTFRPYMRPAMKMHAVTFINLLKRFLGET